MSNRPIERTALKPELQERLAHFEMNRHAYVDAQQRFSEIEQENIRLASQASKLEAQAEATEQAWRKKAVQPQVDQSEITEEMGRGETLRNEAQALRSTVEARTALKAPLLLEMAELRAALRREPSAINEAYWRALLDQVLIQDGLREALLQAFVLSRDLYLSKLGDMEPVLAARCNGQPARQAFIAKGAWDVFSNELERLFAGAENDMEAPLLASLPAPVRGEVVAETPVELHRLRQTAVSPLNRRTALR
ncbi:exonuclease SbcC [Pseudomonas citronellolis]|uniref:exonuclease SbcC n=1 Tax=Pseudomonas citronellolis TaxID=53408 RepID=UPI000E2E449C|nr:exonuclease SbcC [Pseudomonas citronellolis]